MFRFILSNIALAVCLCLTPAIAGATTGVDSSAGRAVKPADVYVKVQRVQGELELLRYHMGKPLNQKPDIELAGAAPREVYFQALALLRNADQLQLEHTHETYGLAEIPEGEIRAADVARVIDATLGRLARVKAELGISDTTEPVAFDPNKTPTDVFRAVVKANRQLNLLLDRRMTPGAVFQEVTMGLSYVSRLLEQFPEAEATPEPPPFEAGKQPHDVHAVLMRCYEKIRAIASTSGLEILELKSAGGDQQSVEPSDVYHIASLLVSELAHLHSRLPETSPPREVYYAGRKFPSQVYQRAGLLEIRLDQLQAFVDANPDWLTSSEESP